MFLPSNSVHATGSQSIRYFRRRFPSCPGRGGTHGKSRVCGLARCVEKDIAAHEALKAAGERERIHLVVATSPIHRKYKLGKSREQIRNMAVKSVAMASDLCGEVQFSAEDASRTEPEFLAEIVESVIDAGAAVINIPDTVGFTMPEEYFRLISYLKSHVPNVDRIRLFTRTAC